MLTRERIDALRAMANQDVSPNERDIARAKLQAAGLPPTPPRPPAPPAAPAPMPMWGMSFSTNGTAFSNTGGVWIFVNGVRVR